MTHAMGTENSSCVRIVKKIHMQGVKRTRCSLLGLLCEMLEQETSALRCSKHRQSSICKRLLQHSRPVPDSKQVHMQGGAALWLAAQLTAAPRCLHEDKLNKRGETGMYTFPHPAASLCFLNLRCLCCSNLINNPQESPAGCHHTSSVKQDRTVTAVRKNRLQA